MALYDFVKAVSKSSLLRHLKSARDNDERRWRKDAIDAFVSHEELAAFTETGGIDHGETTGLTDDDHTQYLLASDATDRATFASNWTDLTDNGDTTLHDHADALHDDRADEIHSITNLAGGGAPEDYMVIEDADDSWNKKSITLTTLGGSHSHSYLLSEHWLGNGFLEQDHVSLSWDDATRTLTVEATPDATIYYHEGFAYYLEPSPGGKTVTIDDTEGLWVIYLDGDTLTAVNSPSHDDIEEVIEHQCIVAYVYWDATNNDGRLMSEVHGCNMAPVTHRYLHEAFGAQLISGCALGDMSVDGSGASDASAQFSITAGEFYDEDVEHTISAIGQTDTKEVYYTNGDGDTRWVDAEATFPVYAIGGVIAYNASGTLTAADNNKYILYHVFATNIKTDAGAAKSCIMVPGEAQYDNKTAAREAAYTEILDLSTGSWPIEETVPIATVIYQHLASYSNGVEAIIVSTDTGDDYIDWRFSYASGSGSSSATDHGSLSGLSDDDHTQYLLAAGTRGLSADWDAGGYEIRAATFESDVAAGTAPIVVASTTKVTNLNADMLDGLHDTSFVKANGTVALSADWDAGSYEIRAQTFESDVATGTAPLTIASKTVVTNLNADQLDGNEYTAFVPQPVSTTPTVGNIASWEQEVLSPFRYIAEDSGIASTNVVLADGSVSMTARRSSQSKSISNNTDTTLFTISTSTGDYVGFSIVFTFHHIYSQLGTRYRTITETYNYCLQNPAGTVEGAISAAVGSVNRDSGGSATVTITPKLSFSSGDASIRINYNHSAGGTFTSCEVTYSIISNDKNLRTITYA